MAFIFDVLNTIAELEQAGRVSRQPAPQKLTEPPVAIFRPRERTPELADKLARWIAAWDGPVSWRLVPSFARIRINWVLAPTRLWDLADARTDGDLGAAQAIMHREDPEFGRAAHADLQGLADHLAACFERTRS